MSGSQQTTYGQLLDIATQNLATATVRVMHPATRPTPHTAHALTDLAAALAHLGSTLGLAHSQHRQLRIALRSVTQVRTAAPPENHRPAGVELDLIDATSALRTAADLIASTGPLPRDVTRRYLEHSEWTRPRPDHLHSPEALTAGWAQIANLALITADLAATSGNTELAAAGQALTQPALDAPRPVGEHLPLARATPGWPLPLPRHAIPNEWDGRLTELTAIAWRLNLPTTHGHPHPIGAQRAIAEIGYHIHHRAAQDPDTPRDVAAGLQQRARTWTRIHACTAALHTPTSPLPADQRWSLLRTRELAAVGDLEPADLLTGRTALALAATHAAAGIDGYTDRPGVHLGPHIPAELRGNPDIALAALNRQSIAIPRGALLGLTQLYREASTPEQLSPRGIDGGRRARTLTSAPRSSANVPSARQ